MDIPQLWVDVLRRVQQEYPGAIIAGGSLRDLYYGRPVKDVDIFIPTDPDDPWAEQVTKDPNWVVTKIKRPGYALPDNTDREIYEVEEIDILGTQFDFIYCSPESMDLLTFDMSICQIAFDGTTWITTKAFDETARTKVITVEIQQHPQRKIDRIARMTAKFPEFTIKDEPFGTNHKRV